MKKNHRLRFSRLLDGRRSVLAAAVLAGGAWAANHKGAVVKLGTTSFGRVIVDSHGRTLYLWAHDRASRSTCYGKCARTWPPLVTRGKPRAIYGCPERAAWTPRLARDGRSAGHLPRPPALLLRRGQEGRARRPGAGLDGFRRTLGPGFGLRRRDQRYVTYPSHGAFQRPKLKHGVLAIAGTEASDKIALRLKAGDPDSSRSTSATTARPTSASSASRSHGSRSTPGPATTPSVSTRATAPSRRIPTTIAGRTETTRWPAAGAETLLGGDGNDSLDGNGGQRPGVLGAGDDTFVWDPGDGSDVVEGEAGADTMRFNGANIAEQVDLSANGNRLRFFRDQANITMDTAGVERVDFNALGGADLVTVNDLTRHRRRQLERRSRRHPRRGDGRWRGRPRRRQRHRRQRRDRRQWGRLRRRRLRPAAAVAIQHQEPSDELVVNGLGGNDRSRRPRSQPGRSR